MLRKGIVSEMDSTKMLCRVKFEDVDIVSAPLQIIVPGSQQNKFSYPIEVGTLVAAIMDEHGDDGVVIGAIYSEEDAPNSGASDDVFRVVFADGAIFEYDFKNKKYKINAPDSDIEIICKEATVEASGGVKITGDVEITGDLTVSKNVTATMDVKAGPLSISLLTHKHLSAAPGSPTGPSIP